MAVLRWFRSGVVVLALVTLGVGLPVVAGAVVPSEDDPPFVCPGSGTVSIDMPLTEGSSDWRFVELLVPAGATLDFSASGRGESRERVGYQKLIGRVEFALFETGSMSHLEKWAPGIGDNRPWVTVPYFDNWGPYEASWTNAGTERILRIGIRLYSPTGSASDATLLVSGGSEDCELGLSADQTYGSNPSSRQVDETQGEAGDPGSGTRVIYDPTRNTIRVIAEKMPGKPYVVVSARDPNHVVTVMAPYG